MFKPEDENRSFSPKSKEKEREATTVMMDLDMDLDNSWTFDQIFAPDPTSHFLLSAADQPCSPLWAFSDEPPGDDHRISEYNRPLSSSCNPDLVTEGRSRNDDVRKVPPPVLGFMPLDYSDGSCVIKERMTQALRYFKESTEQHVLAQLWAPVKSGDRYVLTTLGQPFVLDPTSNGLHQYRMVSLKYMFSVDGESDGGLGLPGRVFRQKLPEWTPNVQYYSSKEYPRLNHALHYNVRGTLALPVFEPYGQSCVGVFELIMTSQKVNYAPEVDKVCKALEAVNLKSSDILDHPNTQICNEGRQNALVEILEILTLVCETHNLPLAQTWVPCRHRSVLAYGGGLKKSCSSFDGSCMGQVCMSTTDVAFYVVNAHMWGFREACSEHHLLKGQGVAGRAFSSQGSCFCEDITQFCKTEYPLVHYARMFGLSSSFAICLRSTHTGNDDYILEFFIPPNLVDSNNQQASLNSLLATMKKHFRSLKVASGKELDEEGGSVEIIKASMEEKQLDTSLESVQVPQSTIHPHVPDSLPNRGEMAHLNTLEQQKMAGSGAVHSGRDVSDAGGVQNGVSPSKNKDAGKKSEKKRGKAEKSISLEVLQQYFAGSLKDAAKSLGVCPTTMKRICRQHGISRWPSRKINKVNRSLSKLKRVIESVQGAEGTFTLASLATSSLPAGAAGGSISWPAGLNGSNQQNSSPVPKPIELPEGPTHKMLGDRLLHYNELIQTELGEGSNPSKTGSGSQEEGTSSPTSSCPGVESFPPKEQRMNMGGLFELSCQPIEERHGSVALSIPNVTNAAVAAVQPEATFRGMLIEDVGSSHDLTNLCPAGEALLDERVPEYSWTNHVGPKEPSIANPADDRTVNILTGRPELKTVTIKATYREDIIRFRLSLDSGFVKLKEEVAKRLKLEMDTFDIKYLDDDHEWVLIACDADLEECMDISISSGINIIRLIVHDIMANLGSSCESSGELGG